MGTQLSLFDPLVFDDEKCEQDERPHPLIVAEKWLFHLSYVDQDGNPDNYLYAGLEWYRGLGGDRSRWSRVKSELLLSTQQLPFKASNGKTYQIDFVSQDDLYKIAMDMRQTAKRPQLKEIIDYLSKAGVLLDQFRRNPGKAAQRFEEIEDRKLFTLNAQASHVTHSPDYAKLTNATYEILFGAAKAELVKQLHLDYKQAKHFRGHISDLARRAIQAAEAGAAAQFGNLYNLTTAQQIEIVCHHARIFAPSFAQSASAAGIDLLSGDRLLSSVDAIKGALP